MMWVSEWVNGNRILNFKRTFCWSYCYLLPFQWQQAYTCRCLPFQFMFLFTTNTNKRLSDVITHTHTLSHTWYNDISTRITLIQWICMPYVVCIHTCISTCNQSRCMLHAVSKQHMQYDDENNANKRFKPECILPLWMFCIEHRRFYWFSVPPLRLFCRLFQRPNTYRPIEAHILASSIFFSWILKWFLW